MKRIFLIGFVLLMIVVGIASAEGLTSTGEYHGDKTTVNISDSVIEYTDISTGLSVKTSLKINNEDRSIFSNTNGLKKSNSNMLKSNGDYSTELESNGNVEFSYEYEGDILKETITLDGPNDLSFPVDIPEGYTLIDWPYDGGQFKIVKDDLQTTAIGIVCMKPTAIDANNNPVEISYVWNAEEKTLELKYNDEGIAYPLVIDPTWVAYGAHQRSCTSTTCTEWFNTVGSDTFSPGVGITSANVSLMGGGGLGGDGTNGNVNFGGIGGTGGSAAAFNNFTTSVSNGTSYTITVGTYASSTTGFSQTASPGSGGSTGGAPNIFGVAGSSGLVSDTPAITAQTGSTGQSGAGSGGSGGSGGIGYGAGGGGGGGGARTDTGTSTGGAGAHGAQGTAYVTYTLPSITSSFTYAPIAGTSPVTVQFNDTSTGTTPTAWQWISTNVAGNNTPTVFSTVRNASQTFTTGNYLIKLNASFPDSFNISSQVSFVNVTPPIYAVNFTSNITTSSTYGMAVQFTDSTPPTSITWNWSFGDGGTSTAQNPIYIYDVAGRYTANLSITNSTGGGSVSRTNYINLTSDSDSFLISRLHMNGANGGTTFVPSQGVSWTPSGGVTTSTTQVKFGNASALFTATSALSTPSNPIFNLGGSSTPFTIEQWVYPTSTGTNDVILTRDNGGTLFDDGWGIYNGNSATSSDWHWYMGNSVANSTAAFTLPLNTWTQLVVEGVPEGANRNVTVYLNGVGTVTKLYQGPYDPADPITYGDHGTGTRNSMIGFIDETSISIGINRWGVNHRPNAFEYRGDLFPVYPDINPNSTLRFKTTPPAQRTIANLTPYNVTVQLQNVNNASALSAVVGFDFEHIFIKSIALNTSTFATGMTLTGSVINNNAGTASFNVSRPAGFNAGATRASIVDINILYYNLTDNEPQDYDVFGSGFLTNGTTGLNYPITNFIPTNTTYAPWITFSNFTASNQTPIVGQSISFAPENPFASSNFTWNFGDGTTALNSTYPEPHAYSLPGIYNITLTASLWQNTSVTNTTTRLAIVVVSYADNVVIPDFVGMPTSGTPGLLVNFEDTSIVINKTGLIYNWSFGDSFSANPYSSTIGNVQHVYTYAGIYSVNLSITNIYGTFFEFKQDYITVATNQQTQTTFYSPKTIMFHVTDSRGNWLKRIPVRAVFNQSTTPAGTDWLVQNYGMNPTAANQALNGTLNMSGLTSDTGDLTFTMLSTLEYDVYVTYQGSQNYYLISPQNPFYNLQFINTVAPDNQYQNVLANGNSQTWFTESDPANITFWWSYQDTSGKTASIDYYLTDPATGMIVYHAQQLLPGTGVYVLNYTESNVRARERIWNVTAARNV